MLTSLTFSERDSSDIEIVKCQGLIKLVRKIQVSNHTIAAKNILYSRGIPSSYLIHLKERHIRFITPKKMVILGI